MTSALDFEHEYVHSAYEILARLLETGAPKTWPFVNEFLNGFRTGSILGDIESQCKALQEQMGQNHRPGQHQMSTTWNHMLTGVVKPKSKGCGEGGYLQQSTSSWMIGTDRSSSLSRISKATGNEIATCDITKMPFRGNSFDGLICISVVHHLATETRRVKALKELGRLLRPGGKVLITAWALENDYRKFICQDVLVPAEITKNDDENGYKDSSADSAFQNLSLDFVKQQATRLTAKLGGIRQILSREMEALKIKLRAASNVTDTIHNYVLNRKRSLWLWVEDRVLLNKLGDIFRGSLRRSQSSNDISSLQQQKHDFIPWKKKTRTKSNDFGTELTIDIANSEIHRYYHVFHKGELARLVRENVPNLEVSQEWFEQGNWVMIAQKPGQR